MRAPVELHRDLVLVGGGHSHVLALRSLAMWPVAGLRITLVSPSSHTPYSGMLPGLIAGHYRFEETHIDLARLCQWAGARFIAAEVTALDPSARRLRLAGREPLDYDLVSIDVGSLPELDSVPGARRHATPVKPVAGLWQRWQALEDRIGGHGGAGCRVAVVGGGAGGVELALAMAHRLRGANAAIILIDAGAMGAGLGAAARRELRRALDAHGVRLIQNASRRTRHLYIRAGYLGVLIVVLLWALVVNTQAGDLDYRQLAQAGASSFTWIAYLQVFLIVAIAPVFMGSAFSNPVTSQRRRRNGPMRSLWKARDVSVSRSICSLVASRILGWRWPWLSAE